MARRINQLTARSIATIKDPGLHGDGNGLYLKVTQQCTRSWVFRYMKAGQPRSMGLGAVAQVSLSEARDAAGELRRQLQRGGDPLADRRATLEKTRAEATSAQTFKDCAEAYIAAHSIGWKNAKHAAQWPSSLNTYAYPEIGSMPVQDVDTAAIMRILQQIWSSKPETADRVRGRIESVLNWASAKKLRTGENPARWRGHLENLLVTRSKISRVRHHPALPYREIGVSLRDLRMREGVAAQALEFCVLTAARTGEVIGARWSEIDFHSRLWVVPPERMKAGKQHRVPLSERAIAILREFEDLKQSAFVFPGAKINCPLSSESLFTTLRRMGRSDITVHGFRSSFRDWAAEETEYPNELVEMALAHTIGNAAEAAYRRGDMLGRRQKLMDDWAAYAAGGPSDTSPNCGVVG